jgi:hypothetical protein
MWRVGTQYKRQFLANLPPSGIEATNDERPGGQPVEASALLKLPFFLLSLAAMFKLRIVNLN